MKIEQLTIRVIIFFIALLIFIYLIWQELQFISYYNSFQMSIDMISEWRLHMQPGFMIFRFLVFSSFLIYLNYEGMRLMDIWNKRKLSND
ncbi:hypothetical protein J3E07_001665 [Methanococcus voltae]|uniref:Uncharacterized protein n=1 Tax=Methanococcus voltae TaxID=2188 RepID=A0A8J7UU04_METVO|nr:hypothetical protein [Methanococcus voltae]MBP2202224.1 hypothetical protein [Methanococcus voltae]